MPNDDYIKRSDAVFAFCGACEGTEICGQMGEPCDEVKQIRAIPAADVEPVRRGRWIRSDLDDGFVTCSECKRMRLQNRMAWNLNAAERRGLFIFYCPKCGAKMDGEADDAT